MVMVMVRVMVRVRVGVRVGVKLRLELGSVPDISEGLRECDGGESAAMREGACVDVGEGLGQCEGGEVVVFELIFVDCCGARRHGDAHVVLCVSERGRVRG